MKDSFENDDDVFTGKDHTPLRANAFEKLPQEKIEIIEKSYSFKKDNYPYFSMYPLFDACIGLTTRGTQYDLTDFTIPVDCLYTQSNSFKDDVVTINYKSGKLLLILSND